MSAPIPMNEERRLEALRRYGVLDTEPEEQFDRLTRLVQRQLAAPMCLISLIDMERQWFKSCMGLDVTETPRDLAFCAHAILEDETLIVPDAKLDSRFATNPLVTGAPHIRFYMGAPLTTPDGYRIGTLCVIDTEPRESVSEKDRMLVEDIANVVVDELEMRRQRIAHTRGLHEELEATRQRSRAAERAKAQFLAMMGHELRTPLNGVLTAARIIKRGAGAAQAAQMADVVIESGARLERAVNSLLTYAALDREEVALQEETVNLSDKVASITKSAQAAAYERDVRIETSAEPVLVQADRVQLGEALNQLVLNAISYGPRGGLVTIDAGMLADGSAQIMVLDEGPGLDAERLQRAMRAFEQLETGMSRSREGLGLGLPLAQRLAELHGGLLKVRRRRGRAGTCAVITLPAWRVLRMAEAGESEDSVSAVG